MESKNSKIKEDLKRMYDLKAETYGSIFEDPAGRHFMTRKLNTALSLGSFEKGMQILEIGCANGSFTFELAKLGFRMTGLDLSSQCIQYAKEKSKKSGIQNIDFVEADAEDLSIFSDNTFDGVISFSTLRYIPNVQQAVNEIFRVVKHKKSIVIDFPNKRSPWFRYLKPFLTGSSHIHDHQYSTGEAKKFMQTSGFQKIQIKRILYTPKNTKGNWLSLIKYFEKIGEMPLLNYFAAIIMCSGIKP